MKYFYDSPLKQEWTEKLKGDFDDETLLLLFLASIVLAVSM